MNHTVLLNILLGCVLFALRRADASAQQAQDLWHQMLAAKKIDRVSVHSFVISSTAISGSARFNLNAGRERSTIVGAVPNGWWVFDDYRPGKLGYSVLVYDFGSHLGWISLIGTPAQVLDPRDREQDRWMRTMAIYFCDLEGFRPTLQEASRSGSYDVIKAAWDDQTLVYYLDRSTHLPRKLEIQRMVEFTVPARGDSPAKPTKVLDTTPIEMKDYHSVNGVQVPARVKLWDSWDRVDVELNVDLPPNLFKTPPNNVNSAEDWKRTASVERQR